MWDKVQVRSLVGEIKTTFCSVFKCKSLESWKDFNTNFSFLNSTLNLHYEGFLRVGHSKRGMLLDRVRKPY